MKAASAYGPRTARITTAWSRSKTSTIQPTSSARIRTSNRPCEPKTIFELSHPEHAETRRRRDARVERRRDTQCQHRTRLQRIDHAVVPKASARKIATRLVLVLRQRRACELSLLR